MAMGMIRGNFSINGDGKFSCMERVIGYGFGGRGWKQRNRSAGAEYYAGRSHAQVTQRQEDVIAEVGRAVQLILAGLNEDALREMDRDACREALEGAGLDPEEFAYLTV